MKRDLAHLKKKPTEESDYGTNRTVTGYDRKEMDEKWVSSTQ